MPIKIDFHSNSENGHNGSYPIGTLYDVYLDDNVIRAKSVIWNNEYPEEDKYLKTATAEGRSLGTSWELYYSTSENVEGIEYLRDIKFGATVIVKNPAYGNRTPILSIAESREMEEELNTLRDNLYSLLNLCDEMYWDLMEIERTEEAVASLDTVSARMKEMMSALKERKNNALSTASDLEAQKAALETELAETKTKLEEYEREKAEAEEKAARAEKLNTRKSQLSDAGISLTDEEFTAKESFFIGMSDEVFTEYVNTTAVIIKRANASTNNIDVPEPFSKQEYNITEIASAIREERKVK